MIIATAPEATHTASHWAGRAEWGPGRAQWTLHLLFDRDPTFDEATRPVRSALARVGALDVVPARWAHLTLTSLGFTDTIDPDAAAAAADEVFAAASVLDFRGGFPRLQSGKPTAEIAHAGAELRQPGGPGAPAGGEPTLTFDTIFVGREGVLLPARGEPWLDELVRGQREIVERHLGPRDWHPFWGHTSLAYANASVPLADVAARLATVPTPDRITARPSLALIELSCADHLYHWRVLRRADHR